MLNETLAIYGFLRAFDMLLPALDANFTLIQLLEALLTRETSKLFEHLLIVLLTARNKCAHDEDGMPADFSRDRYVPDEFAGGELSGPNGDEIRERTRLLARVFRTHGKKKNLACSKAFACCFFQVNRFSNFRSMLKHCSQFLRSR